jgi:hypothetical protein
MSKVTIRKNDHHYLVDGQTYTDLAQAWQSAVALAGQGGEVAACTSFTDAEFARLVLLRQQGQEARP